MGRPPAGIIEPLAAAADATCEALKNHEKVWPDVITRRARLSIRSCLALISRPFLGHRFDRPRMLIVDTATGALPLWLVTDSTLQGWLTEQGSETANWVRANGFLAEK